LRNRHRVEQLKTAVVNRPSHTPPISPDVGSPLAPPDAERGGPALDSASRRDLENQLVQVRLGIASSLFTALRTKHADTASHSLRVALNTAAWMEALGMDAEQRDVMEVAALLHDVGKIGVPDNILLKPGALSADEARIMDQHRHLGVEILRSSCRSQAVLDIVASYAAWFDGSNRRVPLMGDEIPLGARLLSICDAYDAMTSDQVFRRAMSREAALAELFRFAGSQFDPELVRLFGDLQEEHSDRLYETARSWLQALAPDRADSFWGLNLTAGHVTPLIPEDKFRQRLLDNMRDGVVFVDSSLRILGWNTGAERMTGLASSSVFQRQFKPSLIHMRTEEGRVLREDECPVSAAIGTGEMRIRRMVIRGRGEQDLSVEAQVIPVSEADGTVFGAAMLLHDVSPEMSLEARCQSLHEAATKDPLTRVANRAEFNRVHQMFVMAHLDRQLPCSLIIADIDHFKKVNDTFGHQAGDEVLKGFAALLRTSCRPGDLVARYGGEEFVILCADCDNAVALRRAEAIRKSFVQMPQPALGGNNATSSFGVTEIQAGDTPETMLKRADRALYEAKEGGRNRVVQLGSGLRHAAAEGQLRADASSNVLLEQDLSALVPPSLLVEKLRGFVSDHQAEITSVAERDVRLFFPGSSGLFRRRADRKVALDMEVTMTDASSPAGPNGGVASKTLVRVRVSLKRNRDRRNADALDRARQLLASLKSYLMATEEKAMLGDGDKGEQPQDRRHTDHLETS
jgi:diguanylate cyclase (GGDEF)-like protein/putative nucleotidyltransferase with HDIG domain/PAS domain S-box-containing protein